MTTETNPVELATELTIAWLSNPNTRTSPEDVPAVLRSMYDAVAPLGDAKGAAPAETETEEYVPVVSVRKSLASKDHIISMIDGRPYKMLRRHLSTNGLTPDQYRERYNLKPDYPMVAESYSEARRAMARKIGLGRKPGQANAGKTAPAVGKAEPAAEKPRRKLKVTTPRNAE